eukprot:365084-Chlamydomonas_euryale.AAC.17
MLERNMTVPASTRPCPRTHVYTPEPMPTHPHPRPHAHVLLCRRKPSVSEVVAKAPPRWGRVVGQVIRMNRAAASPASDLWATRCIHKRPMERCVRMRYNPHTGEWVTDDGEARQRSVSFSWVCGGVGIHTTISPGRAETAG